MKAIRRFSVRTVLPEPIAALGELALNLRWSWYTPARQLFASIDPERWESVRRDPVRLLSALSRTELERLAADELRSANAEIEILLREALARRGVKPKAAAPARRGRPPKEESGS